MIDIVDANPEDAARADGAIIGREGRADLESSAE